MLKTTLVFLVASFFVPLPATSRNVTGTMVTTDEPYVEFDMTPLPHKRGGWRLTLTVETERVEYTDKLGPTGGPIELFDLCDGFVVEMKDQGFKAEVVEKSKIRVYGITRDGKFYPATKGSVKSPDLKKDELPKVKNPMKAL